jgi:hypothetical protein
MVSENCPKLGSSGAQGFDPYPEVFKKSLQQDEMPSFHLPDTAIC